MTSKQQELSIKLKFPKKKPKKDLDAESKHFRHFFVRELLKIQEIFMTQLMCYVTNGESANDETCYIKLPTFVDYPAFMTSLLFRLTDRFAKISKRFSIFL